MCQMIARRPECISATGNSPNHESNHHTDRYTFLGPSASDIRVETFFARARCQGIPASLISYILRKGIPEELKLYMENVVK